MAGIWVATKKWARQGKDNNDRLVEKIRGKRKKCHGLATYVWQCSQEDCWKKPGDHRSLGGIESRQEHRVLPEGNGRKVVGSREITVAKLPE